MDDNETTAPPRITGAPDAIWLVYGELEHDDTHRACCRDGEVTWCEDSQYPCDVRYVRVDLYEAQAAEIERLREDAERYRFIRGLACWSYPSGEGSDGKDVYLVITGCGYHYDAPDEATQVDAAIDAAKESKHAK